MILSGTKSVMTTSPRERIYKKVVEHFNSKTNIVKKMKKPDNKFLHRRALSFITVGGPRLRDKCLNEWCRRKHDVCPLISCKDKECKGLMNHPDILKLYLAGKGKSKGKGGKAKGDGKGGGKGKGKGKGGGKGWY